MYTTNLQEKGVRYKDNNNSTNKLEVDCGGKLVVHRRVCS